MESIRVLQLQMALKAAKKEVEEVLRREQSLKTKLEAFQDEIQDAYAQIHTLGGEVSQALCDGLHTSP